MTDFVLPIAEPPRGLASSKNFSNLGVPILNVVSSSPTSGRISQLSTSKQFTSLKFALKIALPGVNFGLPRTYTNTSYISPRLTRAYASIF